MHGAVGEDPTEPEHSTPYPYPPLSHEPAVERLATALRRQGLHPFHMANGMHLGTMEERRADATADGSPSATGAKSDAENRAVRPALESPNVRLLLGAYVRRLHTGPDGHRVVAAEAQVGERTVRIEAKTFVVAGGAVNSAALLLRSVSDQHPAGLGNSSGLLGRNYMVHNSTFFMAVDPLRRNQTAWQKTLGLNDWYEPGPDNPYPLGNLQMLGKLQAPMVKSARPWAPMWALKLVTDRSLDIYLTTEDLPRPDNRVSVDGDKIMINWTPNNLAPHRRAGEAGQPGRTQGRLPDRADRTDGYRDQLPHVRDRCGRHGSVPQRSRPRLPQPRRGRTSTSSTAASSPPPPPSTRPSRLPRTRSASRLPSSRVPGPRRSPQGGRPP